MMDAREVAGKLTKAARSAMENARKLAPELHGIDVYEVNAGGATISLCRQGLIRDREFRGITGRSRRGYALTPLGVAVRSALLTEKDTHDG